MPVFHSTRRFSSVLVTCLFAGAVLLAPTAAIAQATKMKQAFKNKSDTDANDFHMETTLLIKKQPMPTSDVFKTATISPDDGVVDFKDGTVKAKGGTHTVEWTSTGKTSKITKHYFTKDRAPIDDSSELAALTQDFNGIPTGGVYLASLTNFNDSGVPLSGLFAVYARPLADFDSASWDDTGAADARLLQGPTSYSMSAGGNGSPLSFSLAPDEYLVIVGTTDDGDSVSAFSTAFNANPSAPEPGAGLLAAVGLIAAACQRRRKK